MKLRIGRCSVQKWLRAIGGILAMVGYLMYSYLVTYYLNINAPSVSQCFADTINHTSIVWLFHNLLITLMEVTTTCVFQGLDSLNSRQNLEKGTVLFRTITTGLLAVSLTVVNLMSLNDTLYVFSEYCGYKDVAHNCLQIVARLAVIIVAVRNQQESEAFHRLRTVESLMYQKSAADVSRAREIQLEPCGLCFDRTDHGNILRRLPNCQHTFHPRCFDPWQNFGHRCPSCRAIFVRTTIETIQIHDKFR